jgi:pimeloyl-ACP methyl ester carboxylesterase
LSSAGIRYSSPFKETTLLQKYFGELYIARQRKNLPQFQLAEYYKTGLEESHYALVKKQVDMTKWQLRHSPGYLGAILSTFRNFPLRYMDDLYAAIGKHPRRVLVICGNQDTVCDYRKCIQILEECFPRGEIVDVVDCGHNILFEKFDETTTELLSFHREVFASFTEQA